MEEQALLDLYPGQSGEQSEKMRMQYRANVVQDLIKNSLVGGKKLMVLERVLGELRFNESVFVSATSADQMGKTDNRLSVWTTLPEANNRKRMVTLLEMVQAKEGGAWTIVQQSNEPLSIKVNNQIRTARLFPFMGNFIIKIDAVRK